ncbi:MAG: FRG domain-containing protein, partial [Methylococcales bacterium]|nr:FRG domain-containing protein [Methylococcales bacterium]
MMIGLDGGNSISSITKLLEQHFIHSKEELWFRGQANYEHKLIPALFREQYDEARMYEEFIRRFPEHSNNHRDIFEWLTLMQHYGLPTRLLDWTTNLLVALFFCCNDEKDKDGAIFL